MSKYQEGKIYKIVSSQTSKVYIGSTCQTLAKRMIAHRSQYKMYTQGRYAYLSSFDIVQYPDSKIVLIENYPCDTIDELRIGERYWVEHLDCCNKTIPGRTMKEYQEANIEKIREYQKQYRDDHKDKMREYQKKYQPLYKEANKEKLQEYQRQYRLANRYKVHLRRQIEV